MGKVVFLLEEYSMKVLLEGLLPRLFPDLTFQLIPHEGKQDLEKSIPLKLRAWREPGARFVILRDNGGGECRRLADRLAELRRQGSREDAVVRIACLELEAWYVGEPDALADAFGREELRTLGRKARYRDPDCVATPSAALMELIPAFQKVMGARLLSRHLTRERNRSSSFHALVRGVERLGRAG